MGGGGLTEGPDRGLDPAEKKAAAEKEAFFSPGQEREGCPPQQGGEAGGGERRALRARAAAQAPDAKARTGPPGSSIGAAEKKALEQAFADNPYPTKEDKDALSHQLGVSYKDVQHFFSKKRRTQAFLAPRGAWPTPADADGAGGAGAQTLSKLREEVARELRAAEASEEALPRARFLEAAAESKSSEAQVASWVEGSSEPLAALVTRVGTALHGSQGAEALKAEVRDRILMYATRKAYAPGAEAVGHHELLEAERAEWGLHWEVYQVKSLPAAVRALAQEWRKRHKARARKLHDLKKAATLAEAGDLQSRCHAERLLAKVRGSAVQDEAAARQAAERAAALEAAKEARQSEKATRTLKQQEQQAAKRADLEAIKDARARERAAAAAKLAEERSALKEAARQQREASKEAMRREREAAQEAVKQQREAARESAKQQREAAKEAAKRQREATQQAARQQREAEKEAAKRQREAAAEAVKQQREAAAEAKRREQAAKAEARDAERKKKEDAKAAKRQEEEEKAKKQKQMASMFFQKMGVKKAPVQQQPTRSLSARSPGAQTDRKFLPGDRSQLAAALTEQMETELAGPPKPITDLVQALLSRTASVKRERRQALSVGLPPPFARRPSASCAQQAGPSSPASKCPPQRASQDATTGDMVCFRRKLLQFHENDKDQGGSGRPAYYGSWRRRSACIRARRPLAKDPELDYEIDSADEWEEPEDGEDLLSDGEDQKEEEEGEELSGWTDGFMVEDGYLSEGEGARVADLDLVEEQLDEGESPPTGEGDDHVPSNLAVKRARRDMCQLLNRAQKAGKPLVVCCAGLRLEEAQDRVAVGDPSLLKALKMEVHFAKKVLVPERPTPCKRAAEAEARDEETLAKKRKIMSEQQERALEEAFEKNPWLSKEEKTELSEQIGLKYTTVQGFFAKKRRSADFLNSGRQRPDAVEKEAAATAKKEAAAAKKEAAAEARKKKEEAAAAKKEAAAAKELAERRKLMSEEQELALEDIFWKNPFPSVPEQTDMSQRLGLLYSAVRDYFSKKRRSPEFLNCDRPCGLCGERGHYQPQCPQARAAKAAGKQ